jgi:hypothetical protein
VQDGRADLEKYSVFRFRTVISTNSKGLVENMNLQGAAMMELGKAIM